MQPAIAPSALRLALRRHASVPLYRQIATVLRERIAGGDLPPGTRLPAERDLARALGVNRTTVVAAYDELEAEGLVDCRPGRGTVVGDGARAAPGPDWDRRLGAAATRWEFPLVREMQDALASPDLVPLAHGEPGPDLWPRKALGRLLRRASLDRVPLGYPEPHGYRGLREVLVDRLRRRGIAVGPESIVLVNGSQQGFHLIAQTLLSPGDAVAVERPSYLGTLGLFAGTGIRPVSVPVGAAGLDFGALEAALGDGRLRALFTIPTCQSPTGTTLGEADRRRLVSLAVRRRLLVVEDDPFGDLVLDGPAPRSLKAYDTTGSVITLGTLSKTAAPALRVGWLVAPAPVAEVLARARLQFDLGGGVLSEWVAAEWLASGGYDEHLTWLRGALAERRAAMLDALERWLGGVATWVAPAGGYHVWCRLDVRAPSVAVFREAVRHGVAVVPGAAYRYEPGAPHVRLSFCHAPPDQIAEGVRRLRRALDRLVSGGGLTIPRAAAPRRQTIPPTGAPGQA